MRELIFKTGSLMGRRWSIPSGGALTIGRSHSCAIRPEEADVSGRHVIVREEHGKLWLEALSAHRTAVDGTKLAAGGRKELADGSVVNLGGSLAFTVGESQGGTETASEMGETDIFATDAATGLETRATAATRAAETGTLATAATRAMSDETGTLATAATRAAPTGGIPSGNPAGAARPAGRPLGPAAARSGGGRPRGRALDDDATTDIGLAAMPASQGDTELATGDGQDGDETQVLATQAISMTELNVLRGAHLQKQKRKIGFRALLFLFIFFAIFALYAVLSHPTVKTYLPVASLVSYDGVIRTESGQIAIDLPSYNAGAYTVKTESQIRYDSRLGDKWEVPFTIIITNYADNASLRESAEVSFSRWRSANMVGLWRDHGELRLPQFIGGLAGEYPGVRCLVHKYTRVDADGENLAGTATFFRTGNICHVLLREIPSAEEGRGQSWLNNVDWTLFMNKMRPDKAENLFAARHWEGTPEEDDERDCSVVLNECRQRLESDDTSSWNDVERMLYVTLRAVHGRDDAEANDIRSGALDALQNLRKAQAKYWHWWQGMALQAANRPGNEGKGTLDALTATVREHFNSQNDERYWLSRQERWWLVKSGSAR